MFFDVIQSFLEPIVGTGQMLVGSSCRHLERVVLVSQPYAV